MTLSHESQGTGSSEREPITQGEFPLGLPPQDVKKIEILSKEELVSRANRVLLLYAERAIYPLYDKVRKGEGKQIISSTEEGRPGEELRDIDQTAENVLKFAVREMNLPTILISENAPEPHMFGNGESEKLFIFADPFDNTSQYIRGLDTPPYTVVSIWDREGNPIGAVVGDIKDRKAYMSLGKDTFIIDIKEKSAIRENYIGRKSKFLENQEGFLKKINKLQTDIINGSTNVIEEELTKTKTDNANSEEGLGKLEREFLEDQKKEYKRERINRSERTTLLGDRNATLATFVGEKKYSSKFFKYFSELINNMHPKGLLYTGGGAYIYGLLASGTVDAYVMFDEPLSEIIPGLPLLIAAGGGACRVNPDGTSQEIKINPTDYLTDHKLYAEGEIPLYIAYNTPQVRDEIIKYYLEAKKEIEKAEELRKKMVSPEEAKELIRKIEELKKDLKKHGILSEKTEPTV